jgi:hypothetical protein
MSRINDSSYKDVKDIYAMSDIHGDLDLLIINLRDCAKVIRSRDDTDWRVYTNIPIPNIDLNDIINSNIYDCLFNFEWCGNNKWIIIIGDIIDNYRENYTLPDINDKNKRQDEIEHEELKIILFLNKLNMKAQQQGGNVIKIIGNHEDINIHNIYNTRYISRYISRYAIMNNFYRIKREEIFRIHNDILNHINYKNKSNKKYVIFKINDFIFVHGGLNQDIIEYFYLRIKDFKEKSIDTFIDFINDEYNRCLKSNMSCKYINDELGILWYRGLGFNNINYDKKFCNELDNILARLCQNDIKCKQNKYIVIGHCIQSDLSINNIKNNNSSHSKIKKEENIHIIDGPIIETNIATELNNNNTPIIFGITASCIKSNNPNLASVYRVDIGASRAFDNISYNIYFKSKIEPIYDKLYLKMYTLYNDVEKTKKIVELKLLSDDKFKNKMIRYIYQYFTSRLPQLLHIQYNNNLPNTEIIRSTLKNSIKNMKRNNIDILNNKKFKNIINNIININRI